MAIATLVVGRLAKRGTRKGYPYSQIRHKPQKISALSGSERFVQMYLVQREKGESAYLGGRAT